MLIFVSSTGIGIQKHYCSGEYKDLSILGAIETCCSPQKQKTKKRTCCSIKKAVQHRTKKKSCCSEKSKNTCEAPKELNNYLSINNNSYPSIEKKCCQLTNTFIKELLISDNLTNDELADNINILDFIPQTSNHSEYTYSILNLNYSFFLNEDNKFKWRRNKKSKINSPQLYLLFESFLC